MIISITILRHCIIRSSINDVTQLLKQLRRHKILNPIPARTQQHLNWRLNLKSKELLNLTNGADWCKDEKHEDAQVNVPLKSLLDEKGSGIQIDLKRQIRVRS